MSGLALALALAAQQPLGSWAPSPTVNLPGWYGGRLLTTATLHVGVRPAAYVTSEGPEVAAGVTVQVSGW